MDGVSQHIINNVNAIIYQKYASGVEELNVNKIIKYIEKKFQLSVSEETIEEMLTGNTNVSSISGGKITLGNPEGQEKEEVEDEIHDTAVDQAMDNLKQESVADAINYLKTGMTVDASKIKLDESNMYYPLHSSAIKSKRNYIVGTIIPNKDLNESLVECKIENTGIYIELPIKCFIK